MRPFIRSMQHHVTTTNFVISGAVAEGEIYSIAHTLVRREAMVRPRSSWAGAISTNMKSATAPGNSQTRCIVTDWAHVNDPSAVDLSHPMTRNTPQGRPGWDDPSYGFFSLLGPSGHT